MTSNSRAQGEASEEIRAVGLLIVVGGVVR